MKNETKKAIELKIKEEIIKKMQENDFTDIVKDELNSAEGIAHHYVPDHAFLNIQKIMLEDRHINFPHSGTTMIVHNLEWGVPMNWIREGGTQVINDNREYISGLVKDLSISWTFDSETGNPIVTIEYFDFDSSFQLKKYD